MLAAIEHAVDLLSERYDLSSAERAIALLSACGVRRRELAERRGVARSTIKKQVNALLAKTERGSLLELAVDVLLVALLISRRRSADRSEAEGDARTFDDACRGSNPRSGRAPRS